jgi:MoaA/NifB/PqqE/SkfB family radical SAM enzyme
MAENLLWARISVDSGNKEDYMRVRKVGEKHWERAWKAVYNLSKYGRHPEFTLGVGFVITWDNYKGIKEAVRLAKENGAHNVRVSAAFTEKYLEYYSLGSVGRGYNDVIKEASVLAKEAKSLYEDDKFKVFNLFDERIDNIVEGKQDYDFCMSKEVVCVVGGDSRVYTCCSLAFNPRGLVGDVKEKSFKDLWFSEENKKFFRRHDPRDICNVMCLYEQRNKNFIESRNAGLDLSDNPPKHKNFI